VSSTGGFFHACYNFISNPKNHQLDKKQKEFLKLHALDQEIARSDRTIAAMARGDEMARRLMTIPGLGPVTASAMAASVQDVSAFSGPREFAAFLGLTPRQNSSGGKERLGRVSKVGNRYLRKLLVVGAHAVLYHRKSHDDALRSFAKKLMQTMA
jgi:transposase